MRNKLIITGAIGLMAAASITVNAENAAHRATGRPAASVALAAHSMDADRDTAMVVRSTTGAAATTDESVKPDLRESSEPDVDGRPKPVVSSGCAAAIANLKAMHQTDLTEDASERASLRSERLTAAAVLADKTEDAAEAQKWVDALKAAHAACAPTISATCRSAILGLETVVAALRAQEATEASGAEMDWAADFAPVRTAFSAIQAACPERQ